MVKLKIFVLLMTWLCFVGKGFPDVVKTIDGDIVEGRVVSADEEYLCIGQKGNSINFVQWRIISLISRDREIIIVNHDENQKKFSVLTATTGRLSAKDVGFKTTDKISDIYPEAVLKKSAFFAKQEEESPGAVTDVFSDVTHQNTGGVTPKNADQGKKQWKGNIDAGLTIQKGNKEALTTNTKTDFALERTKDNMYFNGLLLFETKDSVKSADEQRGALKYERKHKRRLYSFYQESMEHDEIEKLNFRSISSSGIGYRFIDTESLKYKSEAGPSFTYERFRDDILQTDPGLRIGNFVDWQILPSTLFYFKVDFLPVPEDIVDWRLESDTGLRHNLTKSLSLNMNWINQYDNKPSAENVSKNDATILSTIGYNF